MTSDLSEFKVFQLSGHSPSAPLHKRRLSQLQRHPPPRGFEEFFAKLAGDPLVQARPSSSEDNFLGACFFGGVGLKCLKVT